MLRRLVPFLAAHAVIAALGACGSSPSSSPPADGASGTGAITLTAKNFAFDPATIKATAGQKITVTVRNDDSIEHNFTLSEFGVNEDVPAGKTATVSLTPKQAGSLQFFCEYHKGRGMTGTLDVSSS